MGPPNDGLPFSGSPTPSPPVALSDLLAQRPFPPYTPTYERPVTSPDTTLGAADEHSILVVASGDGTQASPGQQDKRDPLAQDNMSSQTSTPPAQPAANSSDWLAKRNQLRPSRNQGSKGDWIRGWSEDVGGYGTETYCGCSESSFVGDQSLVVKGGEIKSGVRNIWLGRKRPSSSSAMNRAQHSPGTSSAAICRNCSRIPSPLNSAAGSVGGMAEEPHKKVGMIQRLNGFLQKAKPRWGQDTYKKYLSKTKSQVALEVRVDQALGTGAAANTPHGFSNARLPRSRRRGQRNSRGPSPEETSGNKANGRAASPKKNIPNKSTPAAATQNNIDNTATSAPAAGANGDDSSFSSLSENDAMARRISRLHRAQALLERAQKRDEQQRQE